MKKPRLLTPVLYLVILVLVFSVITAIFGNSTDDLTYSQIVELFHAEQVRSFEVEENTIHLVLHESYNGKTKLDCSLADPEKGFLFKLC